MSILSDILGVIPGVSSVAKILSPILGGAAAGDAKTQQGQDTNIVGAANAKLARDKFATTAPADRMKTSLLASLGSHATPATVNWGGPGSGLKGQVPTFSGGIKSIYGAEADPQQQQMNSQVMNDMLEQELKGGASGGNADDDNSALNGVGQTSTGSKLLGGGALASGILGALSGLIKKPGSSILPSTPIGSGYVGPVGG